MMKRIFTLIIGLFLILFLYPKYFTSLILADNTCNPSSCSGDDEGCIKQQIDICNAQIGQAQEQEKTLKSKLAFIDSQAQITTLKIKETTLNIEKLQREISSLSTRIDKIGATLDSLSEVLLQRIVQTYKYNNTVSSFNLIFSSHGFADLIERLKYIQVAQSYDKKKLYELQATKLAYNDQKQDKQTRQTEAEKLNKQLGDFQKQLIDQKKSKEDLLAQTQGDEATYQRLLAQAQAQLAAFSSFVQNEGGLTLITADPNWPTGYYSQRDNRWGNMQIGNSGTSIGLAGCLISSVAMVSTHRGNNQTPAIIGSNSSYFLDGYFVWSALNSLGFNTPSRTTDTSLIDSGLNSGKWVIIGISYSSSTASQPFHFVVVTSKNGDDYNLFDPWKGPNISFRSNYSGNHITEIITY